MAAKAIMRNGKRWVKITHPETGGTATVPEIAYRQAWCHKGWVLAEETEKIEGGAASPIPEELVVEPVADDEINPRLFDHKVDEYNNYGDDAEEDED